VLRLKCAAVRHAYRHLPEEKLLDNSSKWLHVSFRVGAAADGLVALAMFSEMIIGHPSPLTHYDPDVPYRYAIGLAGSLMLGWTVLLLWADRKPLERRAVLPLTCLVVIGLMATGAFGISANFIPLGPGIALLLFQTILVVLFTWSYIASR